MEKIGANVTVLEYLDRILPAWTPRCKGTQDLQETGARLELGTKVLQQSATVIPVS